MCPCTRTALFEADVLVSLADSCFKESGRLEIGGPNIEPLPLGVIGVIGSRETPVLLLAFAAIVLGRADSIASLPNRCFVGRLLPSVGAAGSTGVGGSLDLRGGGGNTTVDSLFSFFLETLGMEEEKGPPKVGEVTFEKVLVNPEPLVEADGSCSSGEGSEPKSDSYLSSSCRAIREECCGIRRHTSD